MTDDTSRFGESDEEPSKVLHVDIPESVYWHLRQCAVESRMSVKAFVAELGRCATPFTDETLPAEVNGNGESKVCDRDVES